MRNWKVVLGCLFLGWALNASAVEYTDRLIVKLRDAAAGNPVRGVMSVGQVASLVQLAGVRLTPVRVMSGGGQVLGLPRRMSIEEAQAVAASLQDDPNVEYAEPDRIRRPLLVPNDSDYWRQWYLSGAYGIQAPAAWDITTGTSSVVVAVVDSGMTDHPELSSRILPGYDFISLALVAGDGDGRDADPHDEGDGVSVADKAALDAIDSSLCAGIVPPTTSLWHGTAMAGVIGGLSNNLAGIAGINWVSRILPVRVIGKCGGYLSDIVDGMNWAAGLHVPGVPDNPNPAKVLNLSLGGSGPCSVSEQNAINQIVALNKVVVVAAGNDDGSVANMSPANCNGVIAVSATNAAGDRWVDAPYGANTGSGVALSAPGDLLYTTANSGTMSPVAPSYAYYSGTSGSAAAVSGVVSLMFSVNSLLSPTQVRAILQSTVTPFPGGSTCTTATCGAGIVNAAAAVSLAGTTTGTATTPSSGGGGGGGGCAAHPGAAFDPVLLGLMLAVAGQLLGRRIKWR